MEKPSDIRERINNANNAIDILLKATGNGSFKKAFLIKLSKLLSDIEKDYEQFDLKRAEDVEQVLK